MSNTDNKNSNCSYFLIFFLKECNLTRETHTVQPLQSVAVHGVNTENLRGPLEVSPSPLHSHLQHQSRSFPPRLQRTPSVSSQSSLDSTPSRNSLNSSVSNPILFNQFYIKSV